MTSRAREARRRATGQLRRLPVEAAKSVSRAGHVGDVPGRSHLRAFFTSRHYGLIVRAEDIIYQVEFR
ncbi:MAG: hypothetical protein AMS16_02010 [Planctomycetes bacterium DG_58]|nr:MAG: hypothetical protein AMS16_02010 [Planctomycetes bacterium DG_58]